MDRSPQTKLGLRTKIQLEASMRKNNAQRQFNFFIYK